MFVKICASALIIYVAYRVVVGQFSLTWDRGVVGDWASIIGLILAIIFFIIQQKKSTDKKNENNKSDIKSNSIKALFIKGDINQENK